MLTTDENRLTKFRAVYTVEVNLIAVSVTNCYYSSIAMPGGIRKRWRMCPLCHRALRPCSSGAFLAAAAGGGQRSDTFVIFHHSL